MTAPALPGANVTGPIELFDYVVGIEALFFPVMLMAFLTIMFVRFLGSGTSRAFIVASFITGVSSIPIWLLGWMDSKWVYLFGVLVAIGVFWRSLESGDRTNP